MMWGRGRRGRSHCWDFGFLFEVCLLGWRVAVFFAAARSVLRGFGGEVLSMWSSSLRLGSLGAGEAVLVERPAGGASLWGLRVLVFGWEMAVVFSAAVGGGCDCRPRPGWCLGCIC